MAFLPFPFGALNTAISLLFIHSISLTMFKSFLNQTLPSMETFQNGSKYYISLSKPTAKISNFLPEELKFLQQHLQSTTKKTFEKEALKLLNLEPKKTISFKNSLTEEKQKNEPFSGSLSLHNNIKTSLSDLSSNKNNLVFDNNLKNINLNSLDLSPIDLNSIKPNIIHVHHDMNEEKNSLETKNLNKQNFDLNSMFSKRQGSVQKKKILPVIKEISLDRLSKIIKIKKKKEIKKGFRNICSYVLKEDLKPTLLENLSFCTHLVILGLKIDENFKLFFEKPIEDTNRINELMKLKKKNLKIILSLGETNEIFKFDKISSSKELMNSFVDSILDLILLYNLDGINFNFEFNFVDQELNFLFNYNLINMLEYFKTEVTKIKNDNFIISATLPFDEKSIKYFDLKSMNNVLDQINIIGYKFEKLEQEKSLIYKQKSFFTNKKDSIQLIENWVDNGLDIKKLNIGLSTFGKIYLDGKNNTTNILLNTKTNQETISYSKVCQILSKKNTIFLYNEKMQIPFAYNGNDLITFENEKSLSLKTKHLCKFKIEGIFLFALNYDDVTGECTNYNFKDDLNEWKFPLHKVVYKTLEYASYINKLK